MVLRIKGKEEEEDCGRRQIRGGRKRGEEVMGDLLPGCKLTIFGL